MEKIKKTQKKNVKMDHWIIFALLSAVFAALVAVFGKLGIQKVDSGTATVIRAGVMFIFLVIVLFLMKSYNFSNIDNKAIFWIVLSGIAGALSWLFYFLALKMGDASRVASLDRLSVVFVLIFAVLFLQEKLTLYKGIGATLIACGAILMVL
jgi:bacterial/archaeal transporter family protein